VSVVGCGWSWGCLTRAFIVEESTKTSSESERRGRQESAHHHGNHSLNHLFTHMSESEKNGKSRNSSSQ